MKILLDHCIDWRLSRSLPNHVVKSAQEMGWDKLRNGRLLTAAAADFDVLVTFDRNLKHQQNLSHLPIAVFVLVSKSNRLKDLVQLIPALETALAQLTPKTLIEIA